MNIALTPETKEVLSVFPFQMSIGGKPMLNAYGCVLLEHDGGRKFTYTAVNEKSGQKEVIGQSVKQITGYDVNALVEKLRLSLVAETESVLIDRPFGEKASLEELREALGTVFYTLLPQAGYMVRGQQVELAQDILTSISKRYVSLAEAEVGIGKTFAYLVAAILIKRGRLNDFWNMGYYPGMQYIDMAYMPIVISTSSIALQQAIVKEYIPALSSILMENGLIEKHISAVIRKGKEHYICERNLRSHLVFESDPYVKGLLENLLKSRSHIDLAEIDGLTPYVKRRICVPEKCQEECPRLSNCRYQTLLERVKSNKIDIQVCNHNFLLADTKHRAAGINPLIPNYQCLILDEAHKFLPAARQMYGFELLSLTFIELTNRVYELSFKHNETQKEIRRLARTLKSQGQKLFRKLHESSTLDETEDDVERIAASLTGETARHLANIHDIAAILMARLGARPVSRKSDSKKNQILWELRKIKAAAAKLAKHDDVICWLEKVEGNIISSAGCDVKLCALPKDLDKKLRQDLWGKGFPIILTSGTLSAGGSFSRCKQSLGLNGLGYRLNELSKASPFDYQENALLYISENMPFPDNTNQIYIGAITDEIEKLILTSHGHAVVLFTSHDVLGRVYAELKNSGLPFPLFRLDRKNVNATQQFKASNNGVLFASGAMWEGIDIPGDSLSLLIIVKLPFAVPDPISKHEQALYSDFDEYKQDVIVPDMLIKLKQGFGRLIRTETDTGAVAILDCRASRHGFYREQVLDALPYCRMTDSMAEVETFFQAKKTPGYFS